MKYSIGYLVALFGGLFVYIGLRLMGVPSENIKALVENLNELAGNVK